MLYEVMKLVVEIRDSKQSFIYSWVSHLKMNKQDQGRIYNSMNFKTNLLLDTSHSVTNIPKNSSYFFSSAYSLLSSFTKPPLVEDTLLLC